jgi:hypothetical protein
MTLRLAPSPWRTDIFRRLNNRLENVVGAKTAKPFEALKIWSVGTCPAGISPAPS